MMVVLLDAQADFSVTHDVAQELARLGITSIALVRDERTVGIVLEGWLFDPDRSAAAAASVIAGSGRVRVLRPVLQMAVSTAQSQGGRDACKALAA